MNPLIFILGLLVIAQLTIDEQTIDHKTTPVTTSPLLIQQDSTPPKRSGVVQVRELGDPKKPKKTPKAKKVSKEKKTPKKNRSEKIATVNQTKVKKTEQKKKEKKSTTKKVVKTTTESPNATTVTNNKPKKKTKGLSQEEEVKLLARAETINAPNKIHPESQENCNFAFDVVDEFTGVQKRGLTPRPFFSYTPDEYRKFIKEEDFIRCEGFLSQSSNGTMALNINFYVASREAKHKFGGIKANSAMILHPMDGKEFFLMTYQGAEPQVVDNMTYYQCSFAINKSDLKNLKKAEIDQVKISFQKGFQTYDVFYLDFMIDQFPCFE